MMVKLCKFIGTKIHSLTVPSLMNVWIPWFLSLPFQDSLFLVFLCQVILTKQNQTDQCPVIVLDDLPDNVTPFVAQLLDKHLNGLPGQHVIIKPQHNLFESFQGWQHLQKTQLWIELHFNCIQAGYWTHGAPFNFYRLQHHPYIYINIGYKRKENIIQL